MAKPPAPMPKPLTAKQARFVEEYLVDANATQAAIRAGYSAKTAGAIGKENLTKPEIASALRDRMEVRSERVGFTADEVLNELRALVLSNVQYFTVDDAGNVQLTEGAPEYAWRAVSSIKHKIRSDEQGVTREVELKLWDKNSAIDKAMKHLGLLAEGANITLNQTNNTQVNNVWKFGDKEIVF